VSLATLVLLAGCFGVPASDDGAGLPPAEGEVGASTDEGGFVTLSSDPDAPSEVAIVCGPQGGYHVWMAVRVRYMNAVGASVRAAHHFPGEPEPSGEYQTRFDLVDAGEGYLVADRLLAQFVPPSGAARADGARLVLSAEVIDETGRSARDEREVVARFDEASCGEGLPPPR
jgi:hypothetical protein